MIFRYTTGTTVFYYIDSKGMTSETFACVRKGMKGAAKMWHRTGLNLLFKRKTSRAKATFTVIHDAKLNPPYLCPGILPLHISK
jgi:hypothetical protein